MTIDKTLCRAAAAAVLGFASLLTIGCTHATRTQETTGEYLDDSAVTASVKTALVADPDVKAHDVTVETYRGNVQLSGFVDNQSQINRAVEVARKQDGVKSVKNDLRVKTN